MSLYDVMSEITEKQVTKTETGDELLHGVVVAFVEKNYDPDMPGRVCVTIPTRISPYDDRLWAYVVMPSSGSKWGHYFMPEVGDMVLLAFEGGHIEKPFIIGSIPKDGGNFLRGAVHKDNQFKRITTRNGSHISFEDSKEDNGQKDKITVETAGGAHHMLLDNENGVIELSDSDDTTRITMKTKDHAIQINAQDNLTIKVGDSISITMNGNAGSIDIKAKSVYLKAENQISAKANSSIQLESGQMTATANSVLKAESSGMVQIMGNPIKIG